MLPGSRNESCRSGFDVSETAALMTPAAPPLIAKMGYFYTILANRNLLIAR